MIKRYPDVHDMVWDTDKGRWIRVAFESAPELKPEPTFEDKYWPIEVYSNVIKFHCRWLQSEKIRSRELIKRCAIAFPQRDLKLAYAKYKTAQRLYVNWEIPFDEFMGAVQDWTIAALESNEVLKSASWI